MEELEELEDWEELLDWLDEELLDWLENEEEEEPEELLSDELAAGHHSWVPSPSLIVRLLPLALSSPTETPEPSVRL